MARIRPHGLNWQATLTASNAKPGRQAKISEKVNLLYQIENNPTFVLTDIVWVAEAKVNVANIIETKRLF